MLARLLLSIVACILSGEIDADRMGEPAFMMVLVGVGEFSYPREDGVLVVPVGCLAP